MSKSAKSGLFASTLIVGLVTAAALPAETLSELRAAITGREITVSGHIGTGLELMDNEALAFRGDDGVTYPVVFDAGRNARKSWDGCKFAMFGGGSPCAMSGSAEVELDGSRIRLIIYEVDSITAPAPLSK
jgi:hypothetical protein